MQTPESTVREFWRLMAANDFSSVKTVLSDDFVLEWPQSGERIRGPENFARVNAEYPASGPWRFTILQLVAGPDDVVTRVRVTDGTQDAEAVSFFTVRDGKVARIVEYWPEPFAPATERRHLTEPLDAPEPGPAPIITAIEDALVAQWSQFGRAPGGTWHEERDLLWTEAPVSQLPYNAVVRTRLGSDAQERIDRVTAHFRERGVQFMWIVHPTATPRDLGDRLGAAGLSLVERATGMSLDLASWKKPAEPPAGPVVYREVQDEQGLGAFEELMLAYWELPAESHAWALSLSRWAHETGLPGVRWVAWKDGQPVGKAYLSLSGPDTAAIFGVYVTPAARGHGVARRLNELAIERAADLGMKSVVLHSSAMAVNVYRRLGFVDRCALSVYATGPLHGAQPT